MTVRNAILAILCMAASSLAAAQAQTSPPQETTSPPSSSQSPSTEAPATDTTSSPAAASSPHQRQAMAKHNNSKMLKDCMAKERAQNSSMSKSEARKACKEQMKSSPESENR